MDNASLLWYLKVTFPISRKSETSVILIVKGDWCVRNKQHSMLHALMSEPFLGEKKRMTVRCHQWVPADHLPGGKHDEPTPQLEVQTASVPNTNVISERDFAKLDWLLCEKPNTSTLLLKAMVVFSNNRTASWLSSKSAGEIQMLLQQARTSAPEFKRLYKDRREQITKDRAIPKNRLCKLLVRRWSKKRRDCHMKSCSMDYGKLLRRSAQV